MSAFSRYLSADIQEVVRIAAITAGSSVLAVTMLGVVMMTPCQRKWMYYIYQPVSLLCFAVLMGAGLYLIYCGYVASELLTDYCSNTFERWTHMPYGYFAVDLDNTQVELERTYLCSSKCPCVKIMFEELWVTNSTLSKQDL